MRNKLSLLVNFVGVDKLSGSLRNIVALGKKGSESLNSLRGEGRKLESQLRDVRREIAASSGNVTDLIERERELERAIENTNASLERRKRLNAIEADRRTMVARGEELRGRGREHMMQGAMLAAPLILAVKSAAEFSSGMVDIQQKAELTDAATDKLAGNIMAMAKASKQMPEDVRSGLDLLLAMGMTVDDAAAAMGPAGRLATAYKVDIPDAAGAAFASINNLKVASAETARIFDTMAEAGNQGGFEVSDMARHFPALTAQMQALGEEGIPAVADLSAALQVAMHTAAGADSAGNNIKNLLGQINAPRTITAFKKNFGVDLPAAMKRLTDEGYSSLEAIAMVTEQATKGDMSKLAFAFGNEQARMGLMGIMQNLDEYRRIRDAAMDSEGTVDGAFDQRVLRDATVSWRSFLSTISSLSKTLGTTLLPVMTEGLGLIDRLASRVSAWAQENPQLASGIIRAVAALAVFKIGLGAAMFAVGSILGPLGSAIALWQKFKLLGSLAAVFPKVAMGLRLVGLGLRFMMGPIGLIITGIALLAYAIYTNWDTIKAAFQTGIATVKGFFAGLPDWMKSIGKSMMAGLLTAISPLALARHLINVGRTGVNAFKDFLGIKSPSRVFMALGAHTSEGLARGIERGGSRATGAMSRLARGVTAAGAIALTPVAAAAASSAPSAQAGPTGIALTLNIYQLPGESAEEFAERVVQLIEQKAGIAARRNYRDEDDD